MGLTGGIGSGKTMVAGMLAELGAVIMDADALSKAATAPGGAAIAAITSTFGAALITAEGALDRIAMRALVFHDGQARHQLEAIIHPLVQQAIAARTADALALGLRWLVLDIPLLVETAYWLPRLDCTMVVDCRVRTQVARVVARSGLSPPEVLRIISAQASRSQRLAVADMVLFNDDKPLDTLRCEIALLTQHLQL